MTINDQKPGSWIHNKHDFLRAFASIILKFTQTQNQPGKSKIFCERLLTVSKLPLCISSIGGRKRSARVLSFLSTVPLRSSCSWRTTTRTFTGVNGRKAKVKNEAERDFWNGLTGFSLEISETIKDGASWSSSLWHCKGKKVTFMRKNTPNSSQPFNWDTLNCSTSKQRFWFH